MTALSIICGLLALILGAEFLVRGAKVLAGAVGLSPLIIGLTVVAFGTSAPELAVSLRGSLAGEANIALGNVVGSNIFNVLCILGVCALIAPLATSAQLVRLDVPVMIGVSGVTWLFACDGAVGRTEGCVFCLGLVAYTGLLIYMGRRGQQRFDPVVGNGSRQSRADGNVFFRPRGAKRMAVSVGFILVGLLFLSFGARWLVDGAVELSRHLGVSDLLIGLTIVAAGTSMPELATSIVAGLRGERDIAVGNIVGSNIFNMLGVLGFSAVISPGGVAVSVTALRFDIPVMAGSALVCLPIFFTGGRISRWEGAVLLGYYGVYLGYLVLTAAQREASVGFGTVAMFTIPITAAALGISVIAAIRGGRDDGRLAR
ncbi:MAG: calcium/sodium antiporter [Sedimentisphaerales bacterium]|nr:calcium/sodium antiporter [Sedimentisphaerales bacterium]